MVGICLTLTFLFFLIVFLIDSLGFYTQIIMLSVTKDRFTSSFPNCLFFVSFSCLFTLARIPSKTLNTEDESQHSSPSAEIRGESFILSPSSMVFAVVFVEVFY